MNIKTKIILLLIALVIGLFIILDYKRAANDSPVDLGGDKQIIIDDVIKKGPSIEVNEKSFDFGVVKYGDISEHVFKVINTGTEDLEILKLSTSCGCTKASVAEEDKIISSGESVEILVTFDPAVHKDDSDLGELQRIIYIRTNDPENEEVEVEITANVLKAEKFKTISVTAQRWFFEPDPIEVNEGDYVELKILSTDTTHSFTLLDFGIDEKIEKGKEVTVKFLANKIGTFEFYCAVPCGGGHNSMKGKLIIK